MCLQSEMERIDHEKFQADHLLVLTHMLYDDWLFFIFGIGENRSEITRLVPIWLNN